MSLKLQILSLAFSFIFGFSFSLMLNINYKIIYNNIKIIKYIGSFGIVLFNVLVYFIVMQKINNSNFHPYQFILIILGFSFYNLIHNKINHE